MRENPEYRKSIGQAILGSRQECYIGTLDEQGQFTPITSESNLELVHLGYLAYDSESSEVFIPNTEIRGEFRNAVRISSKAVFE